MSNISSPQRVFAFVIAMLFLATSVAAGALVIWQIRQNSKQQTSSTQPPSTADTTDSGCSLGAVENKPSMAAPEAFKPAADVTKLETTDLETGSGQAVKSGDCLVVKYYGTLASSGALFDENYTSTQGLKLPIGVGNVIQGWDQGLIDMKVGGTRRLVIPSNLAYGENGSGSIPPNSDLVFMVKLLEITK